MALAALGAAAIFDVGSPTADAAESVSPFAGKYSGGLPFAYSKLWTVTISDGGSISGTYVNHTARSMTGQVSADGRYSLRAIGGSSGVPDGERGGPARPVWFRYQGSMALDADGDIVGTVEKVLGPEDVKYAKPKLSFLWLRQ
jgi:hypothetical protein